eukprot:TRINITY_DN21694_c0_g1_i1.p1 TRINITY_DN21694_c0_g1~~TRINITY_DN21694_c0_g1_i1.p1  ORF type:complete len:293 (-),score=41.97 TRINITY_DN21694_c0_g1_i1:100-978(-)
MEEGKPCMLGKGGLDLRTEDLQDGRVIILNFWRPLSKEPLERAPLAVCDASSMAEADLQVYAHNPTPPPKNYSLPLPNLLTIAESSPNHRWISFPGMTQDEWLVFKTYDSQGSQPTNGVGVHSAYEAGPKTASRESVEARVMCFLPSKESGAKWQRGADETAPRPPMENIERIAFYRWLEDAGGWHGPVGLTAKFTIPREKAEIFKDIMRENVRDTRKEKGMLQYDLVSSYDSGTGGNEVVFWLLERFQTKKDLLLHVQSDHYRHCQERFLKDMGGHPLVQIGAYHIDPLEP